ncbi:hypothetical protein [Janibacter melonis]|uniref:hypothetical protein n=1 Tax=Janibacter melonis TaxID=262209 RepID=UPI002095D0B0|nr:hypothetical protein [Janibacter melonis]
MTGQVLPLPDGLSTVLGLDGRLTRLRNTTGATEQRWRQPSSYYRSCSPQRWWRDGTAVASCTSAGGFSAVYLVGLDGSMRRLTTSTGRQGGGFVTAWDRTEELSRSTRAREQARRAALRHPHRSARGADRLPHGRTTVLSVLSNWELASISGTADEPGGSSATTSSGARRRRSSVRVTAGSSTPSSSTAFAERAPIAATSRR